MLNLRKMQASEYSAFCAYFIEDYAAEIADNYDHSKEHAVSLAEKDLQSSLPDGLGTKDHILLCIELDGIELDGIEDKGIKSSEFDKPQVIGYLWHCINETAVTTFIYDFYIFKSYRSKGYGKLAIAALEKSLAELAIKQIKLRVAYQNKRALALYQEVGFMITGYNMSKNLL